MFHLKYSFSVLFLLIFLIGKIHSHQIRYILEPNTGNLKHLISKISPEIQEETARKSMERILKNRSSEITMQVDSLYNLENRELFIVSFDDSEKVVIRGTTGVVALMGLNDYLKNHCFCLIVWEGSQLSLPQKLPIASLPYQKIVHDRFRYYQNVCTDSYSFAWWDWIRWQKEIDWMALHGVNLPLAFTGQEEIWRRVYLSLGLSDDDVINYISGPAFLAWWRMGNIQKWGGPIPLSFMQKKLELLHKILFRMRNLGMLPILPAFAGNVPASIVKVFPNVTLIAHPSWNHFNSSYSTYMINPTDPIFKVIGKRFLEELIDEVGTNNIYNCDTFNENDPKENSTKFLKHSAQATYEAMSEVDGNAIWLLQSWAFQSPFWNNNLVEAYLSGIEHGNALILDLEAERRPLFKKFNNFYGHAFIWCMLQNYGGTMDSYGALNLVNDGLSFVRETVSSENFVGIGSCPEGINQNSVVFEFLHGMSLHLGPRNISKWMYEYSVQRYGLQNDELQLAWSILQNGVYNASFEIDNHGKSVLIGRPSLKLSEQIWYNADDIRKVIELLLKSANNTSSSALKTSKLYQHDLVDFSRQFLQTLFSMTYTRLVRSFKKKRKQQFEQNSREMLEILDDLEKILRTSEKFLLGQWVKEAESWGESEENTKKLKYNALSQITLWGPNGEISDYAAKQWAGTIQHFYKPRWQSFIMALNTSLHSGEPFSSKKFRKLVIRQIEIPFTLTNRTFPLVPEGDSLTEATQIFNKWNSTYYKRAKNRRKNVPN